MILLILLPIVLLLLAFTTIYFTRLVIFPKNYSHEYIKNYELEQDAYNEDYLNSFESKKVHIPSIFDYNLNGKVYLQEDDKAPFVLICHGITVNYHSSKKYTDMFLKKGYSVLIYDHRNHGYNDKMHTSYGYFEKFDAKACIDYILHSFQPEHVGVMGESMGAAIAMQLAAIDDRLKFCIEDCGFSNTFTLIKYRAKKDHNILLSQIVYPVNFFIKRIYKWSFQDVSIIHNINSIQCPILFVHGEDDDYVPFYMAKELYEAFDKKSMIYTVPGAKHAMAYKTNKEKYAEIVDDFLNNL